MFLIESNTVKQCPAEDNTLDQSFLYFNDLGHSDIR
jgi:hypothetical protein